MARTQGDARQFMDLRRRLARNVRALRQEKGLTVEVAAQRARIHWRHFQKIEAGEVNVTMKTLIQVANALEVDPYDLLSTLPSQQNRPGKEARKK